MRKASPLPLLKAARIRREAASAASASAVASGRRSLGGRKGPASPPRSRSAVRADAEFARTLESFFGRCVILARLVKAQTAKPMLAAIASPSLGEGVRRRERSADNGPADGAAGESVAGTAGGCCPPHSLELSRLAPAVSSLSRVASLLRFAYFLQFHDWRAQGLPGPADSGRLPRRARDENHPRSRRTKFVRRELLALSHVRRQRWRLRRPLFEHETAHLHWRKQQPPPFQKSKSP